MTSATSSRIHFMLTTARQMSHRMRQRAQQTRQKLERLVDGDAAAVTLFLGIRPSVYLVPTLPSLAFFKATSSQDQERTMSGDMEVITKADKLYEDLETEDLYDLLKPFSESTNAELVWRLARATSDKAKITPDKERKKALMFDALQVAESALKLDDSNFACHKWYAILLHYVGEFQSTKQSIINSYLIKDHFKKAIELNPTDATSIHSLGNWCFVVADLPWYQRKIASAVFATPPSSTYQEALTYFEKAEQVNPNFYSMNHLMMGKTYLRLKKYPQAKHYLTLAVNNTGKKVDDEKARLEAADCLRQVPSTV